MPQNDTIQSAREVVTLLGFGASNKGWTEATGGNFSARIDEKSFAISASGVEKGAMQIADVLVQNIDEAPVANSSAETGIHIALYKTAPQIGAVVHVHSPFGILASIAAAKAGPSFYTLKGDVPVLG